MTSLCGSRLQLAGQVNDCAVEVEDLPIAVIGSASAFEDLPNFPICPAEAIANLEVAMLFDRPEEGDLHAVGVIAVNEAAEGAPLIIQKICHGESGELLDFRIDEDEGAVGSWQTTVKESREDVDEAAQFDFLVSEGPLFSIREIMDALPEGILKCER